MLFFSNDLKYNNIIKEAIINRRSNRKTISKTSNLLKFTVGDILIVFF